MSSVDCRDLLDRGDIGNCGVGLALKAGRQHLAQRISEGFVEDEVEEDVERVVHLFHDEGDLAEDDEALVVELVDVLTLQIPVHVDDRTGIRKYDEGCVERQ